MPLTLTHHSDSTEDARRPLHSKAVFMRNGPYEVKNFVPATGIAQSGPGRHPWKISRSSKRW